MHNLLGHVRVRSFWFIVCHGPNPLFSPSDFVYHSSRDTNRSLEPCPSQSRNWRPRLGRNGGEFVPPSPVGYSKSTGVVPTVPMVILKLLDLAPFPYN